MLDDKILERSSEKVLTLNRIAFLVVILILR